MYEQLTIFDWIPAVEPEPQVGEFVKKHGAVICHIMRKGYIGRKVCFDCSTENMTLFKVGILEKIVPDHYWHLVGSEHVRRECDRVVIYTGKKQRSLITLMPGREIYECLPWDAYPKRNEMIYRGNHDG